jgi:hypothetical protein
MLCIWLFLNIDSIGKLKERFLFGVDLNDSILYTFVKTVTIFIV